jgi:hypothetical protein
MSTEPVRAIEPTRITQGEDIDWKRSFCDYPATEWTLQYRFRGPGTGFNTDATADGEDFAVSVSSTNTAAMSIGKYLWQAWATNIADTTVTRKIAEGTVTVERGFSAASVGTIDLRSTAKQILDAIEATLLNTATSDQLSYEITTPAGTRKVSKMGRVELLAMRKEYAGIVARENAAERVRNGGKFGKTVVINVRES